MKHVKKGIVPCRFNQKDRMIYVVYEELKEVDVTSFRGHYDDR
ncbi:MAG: hypothetical protein R3E32_14480 [Chitinophagales bacterium]